MQYRFMRYPQGKLKAVTLSYDDGCRADIRLSKIINRFGIKCTFNINSGFIGADSKNFRLTKSEIKEYIVDKGHEIAIHGDQHRANGIVKAIDGIRDVLDCRIKLENEFGGIIRGMAYPDSGVNRFYDGMDYKIVKNYLLELDIAYSRTAGDDNNSFRLPSDWHNWMPTAHHNNPKLFDWIEEFLNIKESYRTSAFPKLFYLWGHSYEFDNKNNWDLLEKVCEKLANQEDVWYATNIEIYNYTEAYNSLKFSADGSTAYNPSAIPVWFWVDGKIYCVKSGELLKLF